MYPIDQYQCKMPPEWYPQVATWVSWPHNQETWPENLKLAQSEFVDFVRCIAQVQPVKILCGGAAMPQASQFFVSSSSIELVPIPTNDAWVRDYGPTFVWADHLEGATPTQLVAIDWQYNAWGGKYPPYDKDQQVAGLVAAKLGLNSHQPKLCFEGGGIEVNASGLMLCTRSCAFDINRNPHQSEFEIADLFRQLLGVNEIIWLAGDAIEGDDTDGHIDQLARFIDDQTIVYAWSNDPHDAQYPLLERNRQDLVAGLQRIGRSDVKLVPLPIPPAMVKFDRRIPASYCNFLICNGLVVVPQFDSPSDDEVALKTLSELFPDRQVLGLASLNLTVGLGSFHCLSQQQPGLPG